MRPLAALLAFLVVAGPEGSTGMLLAEVPSTRMSKDRAAFFKTYCFECHDAETQEGKVRLDEIALEIATDLKTADLWNKILRTLNAGEMPPEHMRQPTNEEKANFLEELSEKMVVARKKLSESGNAAVLRRLNRREYGNTIRDLLGVTVDVSSLPSDAREVSFDTRGTSLYFSPDQFERYLELGRRALDEATVEPGDAPPELRKGGKDLAEWGEEKAEEYYENIRESYDRYLAWEETDGKKRATEFGFLDEPRARRARKLFLKKIPFYEAYQQWPHTDRGVYLHSIHSSIPVGLSEDDPSGQYILRVRVGATDEAPEKRRFIEFGESVDIGNRTTFVIHSTHHVTGRIDQPQVIEIPLTLAPSGARDFQIREMRPDYNTQGNLNALEESHRAGEDMAEFLTSGPAIWVESVEVEGPFVEAWPPESHRRIFFDDGEPQEGNESEYARKIIARFARRAFRGKDPEPGLLDRLVGFFELHRSDGAEFQDAVKESLAVVLASPDFLYLTNETSSRAGVDPRAVTDLELASRLSYFLWSAPPDEPLLAVAQQGALRRPEVLREQVERMLDDERSFHFITGFVHQWLELERIDFFNFNQDLYPDLDESVKLAAVDEVYHLFDTVLREDLSLEEFLKSDFVVINGLLAEYYGIPGVEGDYWRKVPSPPERGGLVSTVAILAMLSDGEAPNPVERGAWVLRKLLNDPPPPAPANVPQLSRLEDELVSLREKLKIHQEEAQCTHCHRKIDPIGFGLQNFDAAGQWRDKETIYEINFNKKGKRRLKEFEDIEIEAGGKLHNGPEFADYFELREVLASRRDAFARGITEALLEYALGRPVRFSDEALITRLQEDLREEGHRLRSLIHLIVQSDAFLTK